MPGLCGPTMMMILGFLPISPTISKTLSSSPHFRPSKPGPNAWGRRLRRRGGAASYVQPRRSRGRAQWRKWRRREILFRSEALRGLPSRTAAEAGRAWAVADMEQVGPGEVTGAGWYEVCVLSTDSTSLPSVRCWFRPTLPAPAASQVPPPFPARPRSAPRGVLGGSDADPPRPRPPESAREGRPGSPSRDTLFTLRGEARHGIWVVGVRSWIWAGVRVSERGGKHLHVPIGLRLTVFRSPPTSFENGSE